MEIQIPNEAMTRRAVMHPLNVNEAETIYFSLVAKYETMVKDLTSRYDNNPNWTDVEDGTFLREEIEKIRNLVWDMYQTILPRS